MKHLSGILVAICVSVSGTSAQEARTGGRLCPVDAPPAAELEALELETRQFRTANAVLRVTPPKVTIPVHLHVITDGSNGEVTDEQIEQQLTKLNEHFAQFHISFVLRSKASRNNPAWFKMKYQSAVEREAKKALGKDPESSMNIYVADLGSQLLGWATFPWNLSSEPELDGVVLHYATFPGGDRERFNLGSTAIHEVGHWLGLYHTFEGGCDGGDHVDDTPAEATAAIGCPSESQPARDSCPDSPGKDPVENFMDYVDDRCMNHFTEGQGARMIDQIAKERTRLLSLEDLRSLTFESSSAHTPSHLEGIGETTLEDALEAADQIVVKEELGWEQPTQLLKDNNSIIVRYSTPPEEKALLGDRTIIIDEVGEASVLPRR